MTKILEIKTCKECPKRITNENHWICGEIAGGNVNSFEIPSWCPLPNQEPKTYDETMRISSVVAERFMKMDQDIHEFIRDEVKAELNRREQEDDDEYDDYDDTDDPIVKTGTVRICSVCNQIVHKDPDNPNYSICGCEDINQLQLHHLTPQVWKPASVEIRMKKEEI